MRQVSVGSGRGSSYFSRATLAQLALLALVVLAMSAGARATLYEVGPGKTYAEINNVPWENLAAGDTVKIYWRSTAYKSKWVITAAGTPSQPILIQGVPDGSGTLPVIDGNGATTRLELSYWNDERGIICLGHSSIPADGVPKYLTFENLEIKSGRPPYQYTCDEGTTKSYPNSATAIWVVCGENITVRNCILHDNGNGFFSYSDDTVQSKNLLVEGCYLYDNGNDGSIYEHNSYCESLGITYQYNHYGPLRTNCPGNNLKDRSAGLVIRYNWIENGNRQCDLVDPEDSSVLGNDPSYDKNFIYGNYLVEAMSGNRQVIHFGGDMGGVYRKKGYFYNNTLVSTRTDATTLVRESGGASSVFDVRNNIIYVTAAGSTMEISNDSDGIVNMTHNWLKPGYLLAGGSGGTVNDDGTSVTGTSPGFTNEGAQDYTLAAGSACINAGTTLHADATAAGHYLYYQYVKHQTYETRANDGQIDIGANERPGGAIPDLVITTTSLPNGQVTVAYSQALAATGGQPPYTWSLLSGSLPAGLSLSSGGVISGTPSTSGTSNFTVRCADSQGTPDTDDQALSLVVTLLPVQISGPSFMRDAQQNVRYAQQLSAIQGQAPYTWSVNGGSLPAGLSLASSTGIISGSPTSLGTSNFTIRVQDSQGTPDSTTKAYSIIVTAASGNTYWVAASGGSDGNPGTWQQPWATIQYGIGAIANGDRLMVGPGTYNGFRITNSGTSGQPKTVFSETVGLAVLNHPVTGAAYASNVEVEGTSGTPVSYWTIDGFKIDGVNKTYRLGYLNYTNHVTLKNCEGLQGNSTGMFARYSDYVLFEDNSIHDCSGSGIYAQSSCDNGTIRGNSSYSTASSGVKLDGYSYDTGDGIMSAWLVEENKIYNNQTALYLDGVETSSFKNNLIYNNSGKGFSMVANNGNCVPRNCRILNNTVLAPTTSYYCVLIFNEYAKPAGVGNVVNNNILYHYSIAVNRGSFCIDTAIDTQFTSDYNVVMDGFGFDDNATYCNFATWKATHNHDTHSLQAADTALFTDVAANDYRLKSDSPAKDAGTTLGDVTTDILGVSRPQGSAYDIGCYELQSGPGPLTITTTSLPAGQISVAYSQTLAATGGQTPYTWSIASGSLPAGLSIGSSTGTISGTPTTAGTSSFTARVTDSLSAYDDQALSIVIPVDLSVTTSSLPNGQVSVAYSQVLAAAGGVLPYSWNLQSGSLPAGLSLSSGGTISGTPTTTGTSNFTVQVTDSQSPADTATKALSIIVTPPVLTITTTSLPDGQIGVAYSQTLQAAGGVTPYTWSIISGSLPAGLSLGSSSGTISGTPTTAGTSNFTARVTDNVSATDDQALSIVRPADLSVTTSSLPGGAVGVAYSQALAASGGVTPYSWSLNGGSLPAGLSLSSGGVISGTPTAAGTSNFTVRVTDSQTPADTAVKALSIVVAPADLVITTTSLPNATEGAPYSQTVQATGGATPYSWSIVGGSLPAGLSLGSSSGTISGTPSASGTSSFTVRVTDSQGTPDTDDQALSITVIPAGGDPTYYQNSSDGVSTTTSATYQTKVTLQFTPSASDEYIVIAYAEHSVTGWGSHAARMTLDGVVEGEEVRRTRGSDYFPFYAMKVATLGASQHTVTIDYLSSDGDTASIRNARVIAMRKAALEWSTAAADSQQTITTTPTDFVTMNFTPSSAGDYLLVWAAEVHGQYGVNMTAESRLDGATVHGGLIQNKGNDSDAAPLATFVAQNLSAAQHTLAVRASTPSTTGWIRRCRVAAIRLTGGRFADYAYAADDTESTTTSTSFVEKLSKTWTAGPTGNWLALMSASTGQSSSYQSVESRMQYNDSTTISANNQVAMDGTEYLPACGVGVIGVVAGSRRADADYRSGTPSYAAKIKYAHIALLPLDAAGAPADLVITTTTMPNGQIGVAYSQTVVATGGTTPYAWSVLSGSLPSGLSLGSSSGTISGTPTTAGTSNFTVRVTDSQGTPDTDDQALSIAIPVDLSVTTSSVPNGQVAVAYSQALAAAGGVAPYSWSLQTGSLPAGLTLSSGGTISGTPTTAGTSNFTVQVTDSQTPADTATKALSIAIPVDLSVTTSSVPNGQIGVAYSQALAAAGGVAPYSWSLQTGSLPAGLSLSSGGTISGTPTTAGTSNFTVRVTDSQTPADTATKALSIAIPVDLSVTTSSVPNGQIGVAYSQALAATGGVTPYSWSLQSGSLPAGLTLSSGGTISGTPTTAGTSNFTVRVTDSQTPADTATKALSIAIPVDLSVTTSSLPGGVVGTAYSQALAATGGVTPYSWNLQTGSLPAGLSLSSGGVISGTPTAAGTSNFTVRVTDSQTPADTATKALSIVVTSGIADLVITTTTLPAGTVGAAYSQTVVATGGVTPYSWSVISGSLPAGLSLGSSSGTISGTPTAYGTSNFTVRVTDSQGTPDTDDQALSIVVNPADLVITTTTLPAGMVGAAYSQTVVATGGVTPYSWSVISGSLPAGLSLGSSSGTISGTPTTYGTSNFTVRVTDSQGTPDTDDQALSIVVNPADLVITTTTLPAGTVGAAYSQTVVATGGITPYSWSVISGSLPAGLSLGSSSGTISGTPTATGTSNFTVRVTDSQGTPDTDDQALSIVISAAGGDPTYYHNSSDGVSTTTSSTYQTKVTLQFTPTVADDYVIIAYADHSVAGSGSHSARLTVDGTVENEGIRRTRGADWFPFYAVKSTMLNATQHTMTLDFLSVDGETASIRNAKIIAIRKADLEWFQTAADSQQALTTSAADYVTMNFTPPSAGDYLLLWGAEVHSLYDVNATVRSRLDAGTIHEGIIDNKGNDNEATPMATFSAVNLTAAQHTLTIQAQVSSGTSAWIRRCRVAAIRLTGGRFSDYAYAAADTESTTTSTSFVEKLSKSWTSGATGNWLALMSASTAQSASWYCCEAQLQYNDATVLSTNQQFAKTTSEYLPAAGAGVFNVTGASRKMDVDYRSNSATYAAKIKYVHLALLPLDTGGGGPADLVITTTAVPNGQIGVAYSQTVVATGGTTPYSWSLDAGSLPAGLSLSSGGTISGTPTTAGTSNFTVRVTDSQGTPDTDDQALSIAIPVDLSVTTSSVPNGQIGVAYSQALAAAGGITPYSWSLDAGSLPAGLSLSSGGTISGTPTTAGTSNFTVKVTDSQAPADTATKVLSIAIPVDLSVTTSSLPNGQTGVAYSQALAATGGVTPYSWSLQSGSLPAGLSLSSGGVISGTPSAAGTSNFTVQVTDSQAPADTATKALSIIVTSAASPTYEFAANDSEVSTTSTAWQTRTTLTFSPTVADDWVIFGFAEYKGSSTSYSVLVRVTVDASEQAATTVEPNDTTDYYTFTTMKAANLSASSHTINLDYRSENSSGTAYLRNARVVAIRKASLEMASNAADSTVALTTTLTNYVTLNFTPATSGDYLMVWSAEISANTGYSTQAQARLNGTPLDTCLVESKDDTDYSTFMSVTTATLAASQQTITVAAAKETGSTATHNIRRARVAAIRLSGGRFGGYQSAASDGESTTTSTAFQQKLAKSWDVTSAANWLVLSSFRAAGTSASYSVEARVQLGDATTLGQTLREPNDTTDYMNAGGIDVRSLATGTRFVDVDYRTENASATAKIRAARICALPLE